MSVLHLILQKKYFNEILTGEKTTEVRSFTDFYVNRLCNVDHKTKQILGIKKFDYGLFQLGYAKDAPQIKIEIGDIYCEGEADDEGRMVPEKTNFYIEIKSILERPENYIV